MTKTILSPQEFEERRALILALLEEAHYTIGNLAALMRLHRGAVAMALKTLAREQQVHRGADDRWRLGAREVKAAAPVDAARVDDIAAIDPDDLELPDVDAQDALDADDLDDPPVDRRRALRQHVPTTMTVDASPSWWCEAPRDGFSRRATIEHRRRRSSKEAHQVPFRILS
jgi:hypothetical protein